MKFFRKDRGFTLIELLVVIAIIGILSSIILVNLNEARNKAKDAAIKGALSELRAAAAMFYDIDMSYDGVCHATDGTLSDAGDFGRIEVSILANNGNQAVTCYDSPAGYCAQSPLTSEGAGKWCSDFEGLSGSIAYCDGTKYTCAND